MDQDLLTRLRRPGSAKSWAEADALMAEAAAEVERLRAAYQYSEAHAARLLAERESDSEILNIWRAVEAVQGAPNRLARMLRDDVSTADMQRLVCDIVRAVLEARIGVGISMNDEVRVRLTDHGRYLIRKEWDDLVAHRPAGLALYQFRPKEEDSEGWSRWQLWQLMEQFGHHIHPGTRPSEQPFEFNIKVGCA